MEQQLSMVGIFIWLGMLVTCTVAMFDRQTENDIRHVTETGMACRNIPGLSMAVVKDGQVLLNEGFGVKDLDTGASVTPDTRFLIASLSKAFTATLLSNVVAGDRRKRMSTNVYKTIEGPRFKFNNTLRSIYATMEDLLAHRMGIPRNNYARLASDYSIHRFARKLRYLPHKGGFRDSFFYNDLMYGLASYITEQLGSGSWKQQMRQSIFMPMGMTRSTFVDDVDFNRDDVATPYLRESRRMVKASVDFIKHWGKNLGSGNIVSTANDMAKWMMVLLNDGRNSTGRRVLRERVVEQTFNPQNFIYPASYSANYRKPVTPESFTTDSYALGWRVGYYKGYRMVMHSGSSFGYRAFLTLLPEMNVGVVALMTGSDYQFKFRTALHMYLLDRTLGHVPWINSSTICTYPEPWKSAARRTRRSVDQVNSMDEETEGADEEQEERSLEEETRPRASRMARDVSLRSVRRFTGSFRHAAYGTLHVRYNQTVRGLVLEFGIGLWHLTPTGGNTFGGRWLKDPPTINKDFKFKSRGNTVYAVEAVGFEPDRPPMFYR